MHELPKLDYLAVADTDGESQLLHGAAAVLAQHQLREHCYFDRHRAHGAHGLALHFRAAVAPALLEEIAVHAAAGGTSTWRFLPFVDDVRDMLGEVFGGLDSVDVYRAFSFDSAPLLWQWHAQGLGRADKRLAAALEVLVAYMYRMRTRLESADAPSYPALFVSFRSHFEGFAASLDDPSSAERAFAQRYPTIERALAALVPVHASGTAPTPAWLTPWQQLLERYFDDIHQRVLDKTLVTGMTGELQRGGKNLLASSFHEKIVSSKEYTRHAMKQPLFQTNRILLGLVYLTLYRLGLPLVERYFLCYALSRFIEERHGVSAEQAFERSVARSARQRRWSWLGINR
jgi:hypothetical protein